MIVILPEPDSKKNFIALLKAILHKKFMEEYRTEFKEKYEAALQDKIPKGMVRINNDPYYFDGWDDEDYFDDELKALRLSLTTLYKTMKIIIKKVDRLEEDQREFKKKKRVSYLDNRNKI